MSDDKGFTYAHTHPPVPNSTGFFPLDTPADADALDASIRRGVADAEAGRVTSLDLLAMAQAAEAAIAQSEAPSVWLEMFAESARRVATREAKLAQIAASRFAIIDNVRALHREGTITYSMFRESPSVHTICMADTKPWPCPTIQIIDGTDR